MKTLKLLKAAMLANPQTRSEYEALADEFEMVRELISARTKAGMTQEQVAQVMGTTQSVIARLESGKRMPSLRTVQRYALAIGARAVVRLETSQARTGRKAAA
ncbi:MAG: helix-turn-helix transcriptional regulator [Betaproteobacteria bacterium]